MQSCFTIAFCYRKKNNHPCQLQQALFPGHSPLACSTMGQMCLHGLYNFAASLDSRRKGLAPGAEGGAALACFFLFCFCLLLCGAVVSCSVTALQMLWAHHWTICGFFNFWRAASCCFSKECVTRDFLIFQLSAKFSQSAIGQGSGGGAFSTPPYLLNTKKLSINRQEGGKSVPQSEP